ncbi:hypothetical protein [Clostridium kluyveri]|uniref:Uncharacterized protein n=2 Tax=Clostridium kluyveri TaxID=1534 RepID=A5MYM2_CLOK5|nr:hypothetical protein [Clostridium kluyveri]EDK33900.1 Conserved hypothetical protein [Clostridium kluyveri DSM 555]EDK33968.1 Hypothetical protein CKL_1956 [Clostridium kluyveri DSM 555]BAH06776.1 hypothetical protein CKR_1725 [Clostridium kluyveri NBRC 12016]
MRDGIREKLLDSIPELKECYEPTVPDKSTEKPYAVILQGSDDKQNNPTSYSRGIQIWLYDKRLTFNTLDSLMEKVIAALDLQTITKDTGESYTCVFNGTIGDDVIDEEWDAIARGLKFNVIALHEESESYVDSWVGAVSNYINGLINIPVYPEYWVKNFAVPSVLCRVLKTDLSPATLGANRVMKTIRCHFVSRDKSMANKFIDTVESQLIQDTKIPLDIADRRYLTISSIREDREADPFTVGQLSVDFFRLENIKRKNIPVMNKIYGRGSIKEE